MRILYISDVYFPRINGVATSIHTFMRGLCAQGHEITLIAPAYPSDKNDPENLIRIPSWKVPFDPEDRLMNPLAPSLLPKQLVKGNYDLVHIQTPFIAHYAGIKIARKLGIPAVATCHTFFEEYIQHYLPWLPKARLQKIARTLSRKQCNQLDGIVAPSRPMLSALRSYGIQTLARIIPTGIEVKDFQRGSGLAFRNEAGIPADRPVITCVSRVAFEKNIGFLLHVTKQIRQSIPDILFIIAGEGPAAESLKQQTANLRLEQNVMFTGYLSRENELLDCYLAANCFVFASRTETQGLVLLEAMALGVPVVSTAIMGVKDVLVEGMGAIIAHDDIDDFAGKVTMLLQDQITQKKLGNAGKTWISENCSATTMTGQLSDFYESILGSA